MLMESRQPMSILPSNYPTDPDHSSASSSLIPKRTLQETTGNVQNPALDTSPSDHVKAIGFPLAKPALPLSSVSILPPVTDVTPVPGNNTNQRSLATRLEQRRNRNAAKDNGIQPFTALQSTAYQQYRARQRRDAGDGDAVWPDHLEEAFQKGESRSRHRIFGFAR